MSVLRNPHFLLLVVTLLWGGNAVAGRFAVGHVSPMVLTFLRWIIALAIIAVIAHRHVIKDWVTIRANALWLLAMGGFGYSAFNFFLYSALHHTSAINVTLEQSAMPLVIFLANFLIYRIRVRPLQIIGYSVTVLGVLFVASRGDPIGLLSGERQLNQGDMMMLGAALCYSLYSVFLKGKPEMHWQSLLAALVAGGAVFAFFGVIAETWAGATQWPTTFQGYAVALYAGILPSLVAQGLYIVGVAELGANRAGLYINLVPVFGALLAVALLGEQLVLYHTIAFVLVVGGILLAQRQS